METSIGNRAPWRMFDGSVSVSISMFWAAVLKVWAGAADLPVIGLLHAMTQWDDGVIIVATLLLFPTAVTLYGVFAMIFAAKEAVENKARKRGRQEGIQEGRQEERKRITKVLAELGVPLTPEQARAIAGEPGSD